MEAIVSSRRRSIKAPQTETKTRLDPENEHRAWIRARQGRQRAVAAIMGVSDSTLSLILSGKRWIKSTELDSLAKAIVKAKTREV